jgi:lycopene beta-cyclase
MNADVIIVGGGLAGGLTALRLAQVHPDKKTLLLERGPTLGGNHTWGFHESDLYPPESANDTNRKTELWMQPILSKSWDAHEVRFPKLTRITETKYHAIRSQKFHAALMEKFARNIRLNCDVRRIADSEVETADGEILRAPLVIDASGIKSTQQTSRTFADASCGWLKYIGFDLKLKSPHGLKRPVLVDATVPQMDGFRYFVCLPWDENRVLVEETFQSSAPELNRERISRSITAYAERAGWEIESIERTEEGHLPLPLYALEYDRPNGAAVEFNGEDFVDLSPVSISSGVGWFHSATSRSLPDAVRIAEFICGLPQLRTGPARAELRDYRKQWVDQQKFYRLLNRLMFRAVEPSRRYQVLERFYGLREDLIERFFAGTSTRADRPKILGAKPLVRPGRATKNWMDDAPSLPVTPKAEISETATV